MKCLICFKECPDNEYLICPDEETGFVGIYIHFECFKKLKKGKWIDSWLKIKKTYTRCKILPRRIVRTENKNKNKK